MTARSSFLAAVGTGALAAAFPNVARAQAATIRVGVVFSDPFGEPLFATAAGTFQRAGFALDLQNLPNAGAVAGAIGGGALDLGIGDLISGINAIVHGVPDVLVAGSGMYYSTDHIPLLAVAKDGPIKEPRDLAGKTIGVPTLVGLTTASLKAWLPLNDVDVNSVKLVEIVQSVAWPAVQRGTLDCVLLSEPNVTPYKDEIHDVGHPLDAIAKEFAQSVWYGSKSWFEADRERSRRLVNAIQETNVWCNAHRDQTFDILVREAHFDPVKLKGMFRTTFDPVAITPAQVQPVLDIAYKVKIFDRQLQAADLITKF